MPRRWSDLARKIGFSKAYIYASSNRSRRWRGDLRQCSTASTNRSGSRWTKDRTRPINCGVSSNRAAVGVELFFQDRRSTRSRPSLDRKKGPPPAPIPSSLPLIEEIVRQGARAVSSSGRPRSTRHPVDFLRFPSLQRSRCSNAARPAARCAVEVRASCCGARSLNQVTSDNIVTSGHVDSTLRENLRCRDRFACGGGRFDHRIHAGGCGETPDDPRDNRR